MLLRDLFAEDVTRDIPPVIYFHEQSPEKIAAEVSGYIVTGGWPQDHPNHRRVPDGIHEQYVRLLKTIAAELDRSGGADLPTVWISGFYGSGKSSFAKLLGLALDGRALPDGTSVAEAWLRRDTSPRAAELREAWDALRRKIEPLAVIFDVGGVARDGEHVHSTALRQVQLRLGYCSTEPLVADFELKLERDGEWSRFETAARAELGRPWSEVKDDSLAEEDFSRVLSVLYPERYTDPMSWFTSRAGTHSRTESPEEAVAAIRDMLKFRDPRKTLFLIIDEVSQYVHANADRGDRLRAFATALGSTLPGRAWLMALGQQKLDEAADDRFLIWAKDRFPPKLRVHLHPTNIRDVVHKRLLHKKREHEGVLRDLFAKHRTDLKLFAYRCDEINEEEFVEVYPLLPGHIDLILQITSALRTRSTRAQGDDQAIRGLLQLLGELFRELHLADEELGALVTLDQVYDVQHTALDSDTQASMSRILERRSGDADPLPVRAAKVVALLELIQETAPTDARLVAQCLFDRIDRGNQTDAVTAALESLRRDNLLGYSEKHGYKIQSSAGEEWDRERREQGVPREAIGELVQEALKHLVADPEQPRLAGRPFPWEVRFSDGRRADDVALVDPRDDAAVLIDFRFLVGEDRTDSGWVRRSGETAFKTRLVWVAGSAEEVETIARELHQSRRMLRTYQPRKESLPLARKLLLQQEDTRAEELEARLGKAVANAWMNGRMYFRSRSISPDDHGASFAIALHAAATRVLPDLYPHFDATQLLPTELMLLLEPEISGPSPKLLGDELGVLELDHGRFEPTCSGQVPQRVLSQIQSDGGLSGASLLAHFGSPPYGYAPNVVKACVAGLLRKGMVHLHPEGVGALTSVRDAGVRDVFEKDRSFKRASIFPAGDDDIGRPVRVRICKYFEDQFSLSVAREDDAIADAVQQRFPRLVDDLRSVQARLNRIPGSPDGPPVFAKLEAALEKCLGGTRQTRPTVARVKASLDVLRDGTQFVRTYKAELTDDAIAAVRDASDVLTFQAAQLSELCVNATNVSAAAERLRHHLERDMPWREISLLASDVEEIRGSYVHERTRLLEWQGEHVEFARARIQARAGFSTLTADQAHRVLRPLTSAATDTSPDAIAPPLVALRDPFELALSRAEAEADATLDAILSERGKQTIRPIDLGLKNREITRVEDVDALVEEIRKRLMEHVESGTRVRLL